MKFAKASLLTLGGLLWFSPPAHPCPRDLPALTQQLLSDLPSYLNRTYIQIGINDRFVVSTTQPNFVPLPVVTEKPNQIHPQQLFFSVLEKRRGSQPTTSRAYWLFLTPTRHQKWALAMAFSRIGNAPPTDVSNGAIALAVQAWLRDKCFNSD